jgi:hypothetical protein
MSTVLVPNLVGLPLPDLVPQAKTLNERVFDDKAAVLDTLDYAPTLWAEHLKAASESNFAGKALSGRGNIRQFINKKLLEWLECLSLLGKLSHGLKTLRVLETIAEVWAIFLASSCRN